VSKVAEPRSSFPSPVSLSLAAIVEKVTNPIALVIMGRQPG
jgi:hypothetical protein